MKKNFIVMGAAITLALLCVMRVQAQFVQPSIHQAESERHAKDPLPKEAMLAPSNQELRTPPLVPRARSLAKKVFGYHPYWASSTAYLAYDYTALSTLGYFSYEVDPSTGAALTTRSWMTTPVIAYAHARGVRVVLVVTNFGSSANTSVLSDTAKQNTLIASLVSLLSARGGDGVNIDFESVPAAQRANLVSFMRALALRVRSAVPGAEISMAAPAVDWSGAWDLPSLSSICDYLVLMGYDYYYAGSSTAGPTSPLEGESYCVTRSVSTYLASGMAPERLLLGLPWFGFDWPVASQARKAATTASGASGTYAVLRARAAGFGGTLFDETTKTPWFSYLSGTQWHQAWYDDSLSLAMKYALVRAQNLGGIGIWALSYESGRPELWQGINAYFTSITAVAAGGEAPHDFRLEQNYPNPFNPSTVIAFTLPLTAHVRLRITDMLGRTAAVLLDELVEAGNHSIRWNAHGFPSGVYFYTIEAGNFSRTRRLVLLR